jgi:AcrR family transcriptional regulator
VSWTCENSEAPSRAEIVDAAIAVADAEGAEAVSMRRIAQVLRVGTMSLYWHVASKEQLLHVLHGMLDAIVAEIDVREPTGDWRADLRAQALSSRAVWLRHRWVTDFLGARPTFGPNTLRDIDRSLAALDGLDIDTATAMTILQTVSTYVSGAVLRELQEMQTERGETNTGDPEFQAAFAAWQQNLRAAGQFDHFVKVLDDGVDPDSAGTRDERFEFGLDCLLDGDRDATPPTAGGFAGKILIWTARYPSSRGARVRAAGRLPRWPGATRARHLSKVARPGNSTPRDGV